MNLLNIPNEILYTILMFTKMRYLSILKKTHRRFRTLQLNHMKSISINYAIKLRKYEYIELIRDMGYYVDIYKYFIKIVSTGDYDFVIKIINPITHHQVIEDNFIQSIDNDILPEILLTLHYKNIDCDGETQCKSLTSIMNRSMCRNCKRLQNIIYKERLDLIIAYRSRSYNVKLFDKRLVQFAGNSQITSLDLMRYVYNKGLVIGEKILNYSRKCGSLEYIKWIISKVDKDDIVYLNSYVKSHDKEILLMLYDQGYCNPRHLVEVAVCQNFLDKIGDLSSRLEIKPQDTLPAWVQCSSIDEEIKQLINIGLVTDTIAAHYASKNRFDFVPLLYQINEVNISTILYYAIKYDNLSVLSNKHFINYDIKILKDVISLDDSLDTASIDCIRRYCIKDHGYLIKFTKFHLHSMVKKWDADIIILFFKDVIHLKNYLDIVDLVDAITFNKLIDDAQNKIFIAPSKELSRMCKIEHSGLIDLFMKDLSKKHIFRKVVRYSSFNFIKYFFGKYDGNYYSLVTVALKHRDITIVNYLLDIGAKFEEEDKENCNRDIKYFRESGNFIYSRNTSLFYAYHNCVSSAEWLIKCERYSKFLTINHLPSQLNRNCYLDWLMSKDLRNNTYQASW